MLSLLSTVLGKLVDVVLKRADLKKNEAGPLKLYELYVALSDVTANAKRIERELDKIIRNPNRGCTFLASEIDRQRESITRFSNILWGLNFQIEIFERSVHGELAEIAGSKFEALKLYFHVFCKMKDDNLILRNWGTSGLIGMMRVSRFLRKPLYLFVLGRKLRKWDTPGSFVRLMRYQGEDVDELESRGIVKSEHYDLTNVLDLTKLRDQARSSIASMEEALHRLGDFIKANCDLKDLFPGRILR